MVHNEVILSADPSNPDRLMACAVTNLSASTEFRSPKRHTDGFNYGAVAYVSSDAGKIAVRMEGFADEFSAILSRQIDEKVTPRA